MKTKRFLLFRNIFFIIMALVLVGGLTAVGLRAPTGNSPAEPGGCYVANLYISPPEVEVGEQATITVVIANNGESEGTHTTILKINGQEAEESKTEVTVPAGETRQVEFAFTLYVAGDYEIEVDGLSAILKVTAAEEPAPEATSPQ